MQITHLNSRMAVYKEMKITIDKNNRFKINMLMFQSCFFFNLNYSITGTSIQGYEYYDIRTRSFNMQV